MKIVGECRVVIFLWIHFVPSILSNSEECEVKKVSVESTKSYVFRDCGEEAFKLSLAKWKTQLQREQFNLKIASNNIQTIEIDALPRENIRNLEILNNIGMMNLQKVFGDFNVLESVSIIQPELEIEEIYFLQPLKHFILSVKKMDGEQLSILPFTIRSINVTKTRFDKNNQVMITKKYQFLQTITISACDLEGIRIKASSNNVAVLDLSSNKLEDWQNFNVCALTNLRYLNLQGNHFSYLDVEALSNLKWLEELILTENRISNIGAERFEKFRVLSYIRNSMEIFRRSQYIEEPLEHIFVNQSSVTVYVYNILSFLLGLVVYALFLIAWKKVKEAGCTLASLRGAKTVKQPHHDCESEADYALPDPNYDYYAVAPNPTAKNSAPVYATVDKNRKQNE